MRDLVRSSLSALGNGQLWALQLAGNAVLFAAAASWLTIAEEHVWQLALTSASAIAILFFFGWLHAGTIATMDETASSSVWIGFRKALRHIIAFLVWVGLVAALFWAVGRWSEKTWQIAGYLSSRLSSGTRSWLSWTFVDNAVSFAFFILKWYIIGGLLLPFGSAAARGLTRDSVKRAGTTLGRVSYWAWLAALVLVGVYVPKLIMAWTPESGLRGETISLVVRLLVSYLLAVGCWLAAAKMVNGGGEQPSVAVVDVDGNAGA